MRDYSKVSPHFWTRGTGKRLRGDADAQRVCFYIMTCPSQHMTGLFYLALPTLYHEIGISPEGASKGLARLSEEGFCQHDEASELMWVTHMAREQIGRTLKCTDNRHKMVIEWIEKFKDHRFFWEFVKTYREPYQLPYELQICSSEAPSKPLRSQEQEQEQEHYQDQAHEQARAPESVVSELRPIVAVPAQSPTLAAEVIAAKPYASSGVIAQAASDEIKRIVGSTWDPVAWIDDLNWIADQPRAELDRALHALKSDDWCRDNATPRHVRKHWQKYAAERRTGERRKGAPAPVSTAAEFDAEPDDYEALMAASRARGATSNA
jgi:hypothetical protein